MKQKLLTSTFLFITAILFLSNTTEWTLNGFIDLNSLDNYANQTIPNYINKDNTPGNNQITDAGATLGRVLFYDKNLSINNSISCSSCHLQEFAFSDSNSLSTGQNGGLTGRHSMRLINTRFANEPKFFWDERAASLEDQSTQPIRDHVEMGFSGLGGNPGFDSLVRKMNNLVYYQDLFAFVYGNTNITEEKMQDALAQFIRSIQSFDSKYDEGRAQVNNNNEPFPNFTAQENQGKQLFMSPPGPAGGAGCNVCHRAPEFDIDPNSQNNGIIGVAGSPGQTDLTNTRSPSLRDVFSPSGPINGPLMHTGEFSSMLEVINHYNDIDAGPNNPNLDPRLRGGPGGQGQNLNLNQQEKAAIIAFLTTLTGSDVYTNPKWSDPFDANGNLIVMPSCGGGVSTTLEVDICDGESFEGYTETGTYVDSYVTAFGCDSTRTLHLNVLPNILVNFIVEICEGESYEGYTESGGYVDMFTGPNGCDSTRLIALTVWPLQETLIDTVICEGETFEGYDATGTYIDQFTALSGCDSTRTLNLEVLAPIEEIIVTSFCEGEEFEGYTESGTYEDIFTASNGCDSIRIIELTVLPTSETNIAASICEGEVYEAYSASGTYIDVFSAENGCDSTRVLNLEVLETTEELMVISICEGESFEGYSQAGTYEDVFEGSNGCDSTRIIELTVLSISETNVAANICEGESYEGYSASGTYMDVFTAANGCDSTRVLHLEVLETTEEQIVITVCSGETYEGYSQTGTYEDIITGSNGCDSTRVIELTVLEDLVETISVEICEGGTFEGYMETGTYEDSFQSIDGCDSTRILQLSIVETLMTQLEESICIGEEYEGYTESGTYTDTYITDLGCDSIRTLILTVNVEQETSVNAEICEGEEYEGYSVTGVYVDVFQDSNGCDSTRSLNLSVLPTSTEVLEVEICEGEDFEDYNQTGMYTDIFTATNGCDSTRILDLVVLPSDDPDCIASSVEENEPIPGLSIFPNPFREAFQISCDCSENYQYNLYDALGRKMKSGNLDLSLGINRIEANDLLPGVYLLQLREDKVDRVTIYYMVKH